MHCVCEDGLRTKSEESSCLYATVLGPSWRVLDYTVRQFFDLPRPATANGRFNVRRGKGPLAQLLAAVLRLPRPGESVPVTLVIHSDSPFRETWIRRFDTVRLVTEQTRVGGRIAERFGPIYLLLNLLIRSGNLRFESCGAGVLLGSYRVRLPRFFSQESRLLSAPPQLIRTFSKSPFS